MLLTALPIPAQSPDRTGGGYPARLQRSNPPADCPFPQSPQLAGVWFTGRYATYTNADTWYPAWAADGQLYSPWTDGRVGGTESQSGYADHKHATTGQARIEGDHPLALKVVCLGLDTASALPYGGRYPCGSLLYRGNWYYGTYCLDNEKVEGYNWGVLGPLVGFRRSRDLGKSWEPCPHTPARPLFGESGKDGAKVKLGAPHFVDFGRELEHSPDGRAYLVGHGAVDPDPQPRPANLSWITGDQIYLARVVPSPENINNPRAWEFFAGNGPDGEPRWSGDFARIRPLIDWNNRCGCVTITYNPGLKKYLLCLTDGWPTTKTMNTSILEADRITGPWRLVSFMEDFGVQGYFVNIPSKFISPDGRSAWLCYSGNFTRDQRTDPPGGRYAMVLQEIRLPDAPALRQLEQGGN